MATEILDYSRDGRWRIRQLPWRRIVLLLIAAYFVLYVVMRATGVIAHSWGVQAYKVSGPAYAGHIWKCKSESIGMIFAPGIAMEAAVRDLGGRKSP